MTIDYSVACRVRPGRSALSSWQLACLLLLAAAATSGCRKSGQPGVDAAASHADAAARDASDAARSDVGAPDRPADVQSACVSDAGSKSKGAGESCTCGSECRTGFCVDGVCCDSACDETCKSCALPSSLGTCTFVPSGALPSKASQCPAERASSCGRDGTCDGAGACRQYVEGVPCKPGTCKGDVINGALACDGKGSCSLGTNENCYPYTCNPTSNTCLLECSTSADCAAGQTCFAGSCGKKLNGSLAKLASDCLSNYLADGVCCNVACSGPCVSCKEPGSVGRCKLIGAGIADASCPAEKPATCGTTGLCDGAGDCEIFPANTPCAAAECIGSVLLNTARSCDGMGTCQEPQLRDCAPYQCDGGTCNGSCISDDQCEPGHACVATTVRGMSTGRCGKKQIGQPCTDTSECESEQCVDGVCCESACEGACRTCGLPSSLGLCVDVAAGSPDPRKTCSDAGKASCGLNGMCDGSGGCQKYPSGTVCGPESCKDGSYTPSSTCNQAGQCVAPPSITCSPYLCSGSSCYKSCSGQTECVTGNYCVDSSCGKKKAGSACSAGKECESGFCAQGVCCNSACTDACMACNQTSTLGLCVAVPDGAPDPQEVCVNSTSQNVCGTTGKCQAGKCAYVSKNTQCKASVCSSSTSMTPVATCDGVGACVTPNDVSCGTYLCGPSACKYVCASDNDCLSPNTCVNGSCGRKPNGAACTASNQCGSGICTEGVCCDTQCADASTGSLCKSCKVTGKVGTCSPVPAGRPDPKQRCLASNAGGGDCSNDGTCDGKGACEPWSTNTGCRQASCVGGTFTPSAQCDGAGHCPAASSQSCAPYVCSATSPSCLTTCTANTDCATGLTCLKTTNQCGDKLPPGQQCKANTDCLSNFCSPEGVCCNSACSGACQSCTLTGKVGTCSNIAVGSSPRDATTCATNPSNVCSNTGKCDGNGGCQLASVGTTCGNASCAPSISGTVGGVTVQESVARLPAPTCNGAGTCVAGSSISCGAFQCNASNAQCKTTCSSTTADCYAIESTSGGNSCISGTCQKSPNGSVCTSGATCASGNCVDGRCCGSSSCSTCLACNVANGQGAYDGVCRAVGAGVDEPHGLCPVAASSTCGNDGKCNGAGACEKWNGSVCTVATPACSDPHNAVNTAGTCNGSGTCAPGIPVACGTGYLCVSATGACATTCTAGNEATNCDTADGFRCISGTCQKTGQGATCSANNQCTTGYCVDGVCCQSSICSDCSSCNVAGSVGTCHAVAAGTSDGACVASCPTTTSTSGLCDGSGACRGTTSCQAGYLCSSGACATNCSTNAQCDVAGGYACFNGSCLKSAGQSCGVAGECGSGYCVQNVCCSSSCTGGCQTCTATPGTCTSIAAGGTPRDGSTCSASPPCGNTGTCDGSGGCQVANASTACTVALTCTGATQNGGASTCDGLGHCNTPAPVPCNTGYVCSGNTCAINCTQGGSECAAGYTCAGNTCMKADGEVCQGNGECANGHCISNGTTSICCATTCADTACGTKALCLADGSGCQMHQAGDVCGSASCDGDGARFPPPTCSAGTCTPGTSVSCNGFLCTNGTCANSCTDSTQCATGFTCDMGSPGTCVSGP